MENLNKHEGLELYPIHNKKVTTRRKQIKLFGHVYSVRPKALKVYQILEIVLGGLCITGILFMAYLLVWTVQ